MAVRLRVLVRALSSDLGAELKVFGRKIPPKHNSKKYKVGTNFIHSELGYRGVVLYPWEARIFTGDDIAGFAYEKTYYQVLVDNRDADELPMELETLRISEDTSRNPSDVKPIRFKNWDLVSHDEILRYQPLNTQHGDLIFKHHLLHHFLQEKVVHKQKRKNHVAIRGTPTLSYWQKKFSNSILSIYENEIAIDENFLKVAHIPYHLFSRHEGKALIAHLARFTLDSADQQYEVVERITTIEDENGEIMQKTNQQMSIQLCGNFNHIYQHTRHQEIPVGQNFNIKFKYLVKNITTEEMTVIVLPPVPIESVLE